MKYLIHANVTVRLELGEFETDETTVRGALRELMHLPLISDRVAELTAQLPTIKDRDIDVSGISLHDESGKTLGGTIG